jgi:MtN3 and saliva related transmembrane protein
MIKEGIDSASERGKNNMQFIGPLAAILTTISFIPQAVKVIKTKDTSGISLGMYIAFVLGVFLWIVHGWYIQDYNLIIANAITFVLSSTILVYKIRYK